MIIDLKTKITFGKYKGKLGEDIIRDLNYFMWLKDKTNHIISENLLEAFYKFDHSNDRIFNDHCDSTYDHSYYGDF